MKQKVGENSGITQLLQDNMNIARPSCTTKLQKVSGGAKPFVCEIMPFIRQNNQLDIPLICQNAPKDRFQTIFRSENGFTLIEIIVTLLVASILVAVAVPNLRTFVQNTRVTTQANDLIADLNFARSEAIKRRTNVVVCQSTNGTTCTGGDWKSGRLIFADTNRDGALANPEVVLRFREASGGADGTLVLLGPDPVFLASGVTVNSTTFTFCDDRGAAYGKFVTLSNTGLATVSRVAPASC